MNHVLMQVTIDAVTVALLDFIWQGIILALMLFIVLKIFDVKSAHLRYLLSVGTLFTMGFVPCVTFFSHLNGASLSTHAAFVMGHGDAFATAESSDDVVINDNHTDVHQNRGTSRHPSFKSIVLITWISGVALLGARLIIGFGVTLWLRAAAKPLSSQFEQAVRKLGVQLQVDASQRVFACMRVGQAVAVGIVRPVVLIPTAWLTQLSPEVLEAIIAHEFAHIRRWDLWVNLMQRIIEMFLFYHPGIWWVSHLIQLEREMCCDEIAARCFDRAAYARSLESVARLAGEDFVLATSFIGGKKMKLLNRVRHVLGAKVTATTNRTRAAGFAAVILPVATAAVLAFTIAPTHFVVMADDIESGAARTDLPTSEVKSAATREQADSKVANDDSATLQELKDQFEQLQKKLATLEQKIQTAPNSRVSALVSEARARAAGFPQATQQQKTESPPSTDDSKLASRLFKHRVPFEIGRTQTKEGCRIEIREVWGTRPEFAVGGQYLVRGKYVLPPGERGKIYFYATASGEWGRTGVNYDLQTTVVDQQEGEFELVHGMVPTGQFHIIMTNPERYSQWFANVYFGAGEHLYK